MHDPFAPTYGDPVEREAIYVVDPISQGKRLQAGTLLFDDGELWITSYRVDPALLQYADKRVVVRGRPYWPSPNVQHVEGTHFELEHIELAPGETAYAEAPAWVPSPPFVRDAAGLAARQGRWAQLVGTLVAVDPIPNESTWTRPRLRLPDGTEVDLGHVAASRKEWAENVGREVTTLVRVAAAPATGASAQPVVAGMAVCPGEVADCGVSPPPEPGKK